MKTRVKVCGITSLDDALCAVEAGADALGFIFYPKSPRYLDPDVAREIIRLLPPLVTVVGVFVDEQIKIVREIETYCYLGLLQFHGSETPEYCDWFTSRVVKAFRMRDVSVLDEMKRYDVSGYLLDSYSEKGYGGTGEAFDWSLARSAVALKPVLLAGGLTPENVGRAIAEVRPYGVDVSSGVERAPGSKDPRKLRRFLQAVRRADAMISPKESGS